MSEQPLREFFCLSLQRRRCRTVVVPARFADNSDLSDEEVSKSLSGRSSMLVKMVS